MKRKSETSVKRCFRETRYCADVICLHLNSVIKLSFFAPPVTKDTLSFHTSPDLLFARTSRAELITWANLKHSVSSKDNFPIIIT